MNRFKSVSSTLRAEIGWITPNELQFDSDGRAIKQVSYHLVEIVCSQSLSLVVHSQFILGTFR